MGTHGKPRARGIGPTRREMIMGGVLVVAAGTIIRPARIDAQSDTGISHSAESIHQEPSFTANRKQVYEALTNPRQFDQVTRLSGVMQSSAMASMKTPTQISQDAGGPFTLFGGYIVGRNIELVPNELVVQAWRTAGWDKGVYSIVRFDLEEQRTGTKILFDHAGFPKGEADHLAAGWQAHYWSPMEQFLAKKPAP
jgi:activator of HSP90 ATPase